MAVFEHSKYSDEQIDRVIDKDFVKLIKKK